MKSKKWFLLTLIFGVFSAVLVGSFWLTPPKVTEAACGASTSSCKTCHEVKGEDPVSKKGDWHIQHSFGDFCQACHLGAATETDKTKAHVGLVKPLEQPDQSCATCHPEDSAVRVVKYGGTATGTPTAPASGTDSPATGNPSAENGAVTPSAAATQVPPNANPNFDLIDFNIHDVAPWLAWVIGIINAFMLMILGVLIWRWKKGLWPWYFLKGRQKHVPFNTLPIEVQEVFTLLQNGDMSTVLSLQEILNREQGRQLLQAVSHLPETIVTQLQSLNENELKSLSSLTEVMKNEKEGEHSGL
ncbi:cytochrome c3 family protein [Desulfosporosinus fructosivorans]